MFKVILLSFVVLVVVPFDSFGQTRCRTDSLGNTTYRDDRGNTIMRSRTDSLGNTTYRDRHGNTVRCHKDILGNTICR